MKRIFLIDSENVGYQFLNGLELLNKDEFIIYFWHDNHNYSTINECLLHTMKVKVKLLSRV